MYVYIYAFVLQFVAVAAILNVILLSVSSTNVILECMLPCFSPDIWCGLLSFTPNNNEVVIITYGEIMGSTMSYSYPTQQIMISNLTHNTAYEYCLVAINTTNNITVGDPVCGNFTTAGSYVQYM